MSDIRVPVTSIKKAKWIPCQLPKSVSATRHFDKKSVTSTRPENLSLWHVQKSVTSQSLMCRKDGFLDVSRWSFVKIMFRSEGYLGLKKNGHCVKVTGSPYKHVINRCIRNVKYYQIWSYSLLISFITVQVCYFLHEKDRLTKLYNMVWLIMPLRSLFKILFIQLIYNKLCLILH